MLGCSFRLGEPSWSVDYRDELRRTCERNLERLCSPQRKRSESHCGVPKDDMSVQNEHLPLLWSTYSKRSIKFMFIGGRSGPNTLYEKEDLLQDHKLKTSLLLLWPMTHSPHFRFWLNSKLHRWRCVEVLPFQPRLREREKKCCGSSDSLIFDLPVEGIVCSLVDWAISFFTVIINVGTPAAFRCSFVTLSLSGIVVPLVTSMGIEFDSPSAGPSVGSRSRETHRS